MVSFISCIALAFGWHLVYIYRRLLFFYGNMKKAELVKRIICSMKGIGNVCNTNLELT